MTPTELAYHQVISSPTQLTTLCASETLFVLNLDPLNFTVQKGRLTNGLQTLPLAIFEHFPDSVSFFLAKYSANEVQK